MSEETEDWEEQGRLAAERTGLPADVASAVLRSQGPVRPGVTLRFVVRPSSLDDLMAKVDEQLERFAPRSRWDVEADVDTTTMQTATGSISSVSYEASVTAAYRGPER